jgi:hypothetical protein
MKNCRNTAITRAFFSVTFIFVLLVRSSLGALPPGYEDDMWCPAGYCDRFIEHQGGFVGPNSSFHECYNPDTGDVVDEVWTGFLTGVVAPAGWVKNPISCDDLNNPTPSPTRDCTGLFCSCFSADATVQVIQRTESCKMIPMGELQVGDRIYTGDQGYQIVYAFAHRNKEIRATFLQIWTDQGNSALEVTADHFVYADGKATPVRADAIKVGNMLQGGAMVTKISSVQKTGLYAPLTLNGKLVVNGVQASSFVSLAQAEDHPLIGKNLAAYSQLGVAPFRFLCVNLSAKFCEDYNNGGVPSVLVALYEAFVWVMALPGIWRSLAIMVYLLLSVVALTLEFLFSVPVLVAVLVLVTGGFVFVTSSSNTNALRGLRLAYSEKNKLD